MARWGDPGSEVWRPPTIVGDRSGYREGASGPLANDMPYTPYTDATLQRLAALEPRTLALMHGSTFSGDGRQAMLDLATVIKEALGTTQV